VVAGNGSGRYINWSLVTIGFCTRVVNFCPFTLLKRKFNNLIMLNYACHNVTMFGKPAFTETSLFTRFHDKTFSKSFFLKQKIVLCIHFFAIFATKIHCTDVIEIFMSKCAIGANNNLGIWKGQEVRKINHFLKFIHFVRKLVEIMAITVLF
jgi:hypothetical protein